MSGVNFATHERELYWELVDTPDQRRRRALALRLTYALVDPDGWDARRWGRPPAAVARMALAGLRESA